MVKKFPSSNLYKYLINSSHFLKKANVFSNFGVTPSNVTYPTNNRLSDFDIDCNKIHNKIQTFNPNKTHEHDGILL